LASATFSSAHLLLLRGDGPWFVEESLENHTQLSAEALDLSTDDRHVPGDGLDIS
jgi:hypothetical protein